MNRLFKIVSVVVFYLILLPINLMGNDEIKTKVDSIYRVLRKTWVNDLDGAIEKSELALELSKSVKYIDGLSNGYNFLGTFYMYKNQFPIAEQNYLNALEIRKQQYDEIGIAKLYINLCGLRYEEGTFKAAIEYGFKALDKLKELKQENERPSLYLNLAIAHEANKDYDDAKIFYERGLKVAELVKDTNHLAKINYSLGNYYCTIKEFEEAKRCFNLALPLFKAIIHKPGIANVYDAIAVVNTEEEDYNGAIKNFAKSVSINLELKDSFQLFYNYLGLSKLFFKKRKFDRALENNQLAEKMLMGEEGFEIYELLNRHYSKIYDSLEDYKKSYFYLQKAESYKDSMFNQTKLRSIARLQKDNAEKETAEAKTAKAEEELKNQRLIIMLGIIGFIATLLGFGAYVFNQRHIQKTRELVDVKEQQERIIDQRTISETQKIRKELAKNLHNHVATPLTHIKRFIEPIYAQLSFDPEWQANLRQAIQIADKAHGISRDISYQLRPEKIDWVDRIKLSMVALEKNNTLKTNLTVKDLEESAFSRIEGEKISSIITNLLSNVDKHADANKVNVLIKQDQDQKQLHIKVEDNGIGFDPEKDKGIGLESIEGDVKALKGTLNIDSKPNEGTTINITIPN